MRPSRGFALVTALIVLSLATVLALAAASESLLGLRVAHAGAARLALATGAENALERTLAAGVAGPDGTATARTTDAAGTSFETVVRRDRVAGLTAPPAGGWSLALGGTGFGAEHHVARAVAVDARGRRVVLELQFHLIVPRTP